MIYFFILLRKFYKLSFVAVCAGIASENISITRTVFRNQSEHLLDLYMQQELRRVPHCYLSSTAHVNNEERS